MESAHHRKKQPEEVRRKLLDSAARLAVDQGLAHVSIQAVADAAGVTKGGLFHHFPSKQALVEAVFDDLLSYLDSDIERYLLHDSGGQGTFTRAYVMSVFADVSFDNKRHLAALTMSLMADAGSSGAWDKWLNGRLEKHAATDSATILEVVRLAADGAWLSYAFKADIGKEGDDTKLVAQLLSLTRSSAEPRL